MALDSDKRNIRIGELIKYDGYLYGDQPIKDEPVYILIFEKESGENTLEFNLTPNDETVDYFENTAWTFSFVVDTSQKFKINKEYVVSAKYVDKSIKLNFLVNEDSNDLKERTSDASKAIVDVGSEAGELIVESGKEAGKIIVETGENVIEEAKEYDESTKAQRQEIADKVEQKGSEIIQEIEDKAGGGCLIATATYGSELSPQVQKLREIRDNKLLPTQSGSKFLKEFNYWYYSFSPIIADYERENIYFKEGVRLAITPLISSLSVLEYVEIKNESDVLGFGMGIILLNVGMYVGVPLGLFFVIKQKFHRI